MREIEVLHRTAPIQVARIMRLVIGASLLQHEGLGRHGIREGRGLDQQQAGNENHANPQHNLISLKIAQAQVKDQEEQRCQGQACQGQHDQKPSGKQNPQHPPGQQAKQKTKSKLEHITSFFPTPGSPATVGGRSPASTRSRSGPGDIPRAGQARAGSPARSPGQHADGPPLGANPNRRSLVRQDLRGQSDGSGPPATPGTSVDESRSMHGSGNRCPTGPRRPIPYFPLASHPDESR